MPASITAPALINVLPDGYSVFETQFEEGERIDYLRAWFVFLHEAKEYIASNEGHWSQTLIRGRDKAILVKGRDLP